MLLDCSQLNILDPFSRNINNNILSNNQLISQPFAPTTTKTRITEVSATTTTTTTTTAAVTTTTTVATTTTTTATAATATTVCN